MSYVSRVETISYAESVLLGDPFDFLTSRSKYSKSWYDRLPSGALLHTLYSTCPLLKSLSHRLTGATGILLFFSYLETKSETFPIRKTADESADCCCSCCHTEGQEDANYEDVLESARRILEKRSEAERAEREAESEEGEARSSLSLLKSLVKKQDQLMRLVEGQAEEIKNLKQAVRFNNR